jgi:hypothetical protein
MKETQVVVQCQSCGRRNRLPTQVGIGTYRCGNCMAEIKRPFANASHEYEKANKSDIISYFIKCVEAESAESFSLPRNERSLYNINGFIDEIDSLLNGEMPYFTIDENPELKKVIVYRNNYKKNDKFYLATHLISKKDESGHSFLPIYITEVLVEDIKDSSYHENAKPRIRISTVDREPAFNQSLLKKDMTIHDRFLLMDEIAEESDWYKKRQLFVNNLSQSLSNSIIIQPILFLSSDLYINQSSISLELNWINQKFLDKIKETALSSIFDRVKKEPPQYEKQKYLEIFPLNQEQREVVRYALNNSLTVITGPPGTGKSQVVLNLLANMYINQKTVLFASKNNKAVNTVIEKMESIQSGICPFIRLGNKNEKKIGLNKIISGLAEPTINGDQPFCFEEIEKEFHSIEQIQKKCQRLDEYFNQYCNAIQSMVIKSKQLPIHLYYNLNDSVLQNHEQNRINCISLIDKLEVYKKEFTENNEKLLDLKKCLKNISLNIHEVRKHLKSHLIGSPVNFQSINIDEKMIKELSDFKDEMKRQQATNEKIQNQINLKEKTLKNLNIHEQNLKIKLCSFIKANLNSELVSFVEDNLDHIPEMVNDAFSELDKLSDDIHHNSAKISDKILSLKNEIGSFHNPLSTSLLLLLYGLESSTIDMFKDNNLVDNITEFIKKVEAQQLLNEKFMVQFYEKQTQLNYLKLKNQELHSEFDTLTNFDKSLLSLILDESNTEINNLGFFEIYEIKQDIEKYLSIEENLIRRCLFSVFHPFFQTKCFRRFKNYLSGQPDFLTKYCLSKISNLNLESLLELINILSKIPGCFDLLNKIQIYDDRIDKLQGEIDGLLVTLKKENYQWIEEGTRKLTIMMEYNLPVSNLEKCCDIEDGIEIPKELIGTIRYTFEVNYGSYVRYNDFISRQPKFFADFCKSKVSKVSFVSLCKLLKNISQIPKYVEQLTSLQMLNGEIADTQKERNDLLDRLAVKNFQWIEKRVKKFAEVIHYDLGLLQFENHFDFITFWVNTVDNLLNLMNHILIYHNLSSQTQKTISEINNLTSKTKIEYYSFIFEAVENYITTSKIHPELELPLNHPNKNFSFYHGLLKESKTILNILKEISDLKKNIKKLQHNIDLSLSTSEIESSITEEQSNIVKKSIEIFNHFLSKNISSDKAKFQQLIVEYFANCGGPQKLDKWLSSELH